MLVSIKNSYACAFKLVHKTEKKYYPRYEMSGQDLVNYNLMGPITVENGENRVGLVVSYRRVWRYQSFSILPVQLVEVLFGDEVFFVFEDYLKTVTDSDLQQAAEMEESTQDGNLPENKE